MYVFFQYTRKEKDIPEGGAGAVVFYSLPGLGYAMLYTKCVQIAINLSFCLGFCSFSLVFGLHFCDIDKFQAVSS